MLSGVKNPSLKRSQLVLLIVLLAAAACVLIGWQLGATAQAESRQDSQVASLARVSEYRPEFDQFYQIDATATSGKSAKFLGGAYPVPTAVRCCLATYQECYSKTSSGQCYPTHATYDEAVAHCADQGLVLCDNAAALSKCKNTGCWYNLNWVWTSDGTGATHMEGNPETSGSASTVRKDTGSTGCDAHSTTHSVRCCSADGTTCSSVHGGNQRCLPTAANWNEAQASCYGAQRHLCTEVELNTVCQDSVNDASCMFDDALVWSEEQCSGFAVMYGQGRMTWQEARAVCQDTYGTDLLSIHDEDLNLGVASEVVSLFQAGLLQEPNAWIGATDNAVEDAYAWSDGTPMDYSSWNKGNPDNGPNEPQNPENCAVIFEADGIWNDLKCSNPSVPVCATG